MTRTVGVFALAFALAAACEVPTTPSSRVAFRKSGNGVELRVAPCPDRDVIRVELFQPSGAVFDRNKSKSLWRIRSAGSALRQFTIGESPGGFVEEVRFHGIEDDGVLLAVEVEVVDRRVYTGGVRLASAVDDAYVIDGQRIGDGELAAVLACPRK